MTEDDSWICICGAPIPRRWWEQDRAKPGTRFCETCRDKAREYYHQQEEGLRRLAEAEYRYLYGRKDKARLGERS